MLGEFHSILQCWESYLGPIFVSSITLVTLQEPRATLCCGAAQASSSLLELTLFNHRLVEIYFGKGFQPERCVLSQIIVANKR